MWTSRGTSRSPRIPNPEIVVATTIEQGGFGVDAAAPVACRILDAYYSVASAGGKKAEKKFQGDSCTGPSAAGTAYE